MNSDTSWYAEVKPALSKHPSSSGEQTGRPPDVEMKEKKPDIKKLIEDVCLVDDEDDAEEAMNYFRDMTRKKILLPLTGVEIQEEFKFLGAIRQFKMILEKKIEVLTLRKNLKEILYKYLSFFGSNYGRIAILYKEQYWEVMEDILVIYCDVVMEFFRDQIRIDKKPKVEQEARRIKILLRDCLLKKMDRILHVLLKVKLDPDIEQCKRLWSDVYLYFLTKVPCQLTNDDILRSFIAFQKFKTIRKQTEGSMIDQLMLKVYKKKSLDELKEVPCLADILDKRKKDRFYTVRDMLSHYMRYFKEKKSKECLEIELLCDEDETIKNSDRRFDFSDPSSDMPSTSYGVNERRRKRKNILELDDDSDVISALDRYDNEFSRLNGDVIKREDETDSPVVVLDDEDDDDIIIVSDNLRSVITIDDDDDPPVPLLGDSLSPDKLIRPPEPAPTPMEETPSDKAETASTPMADTQASRVETVSTPLEDSPVEAVPTPLRVETVPTPLENTSENQVESVPLPLEDTSVNRVEAVPTPLGDTSAKETTPMDDSSAKQTEAGPSPMETTTGKQVEDTVSLSGGMDVDCPAESSKSSDTKTTSVASKENKLLLATRTSELPKPKVVRQVMQVNNSLKITFNLSQTIEKNKLEEAPKNVSEVPPTSLPCAFADKTSVVSESPLSTEKPSESSSSTQESESAPVALEGIAKSEESKFCFVCYKKCQTNAVLSPNLKVSVPLEQIEQVPTIISGLTGTTSLKPEEATSSSKSVPVVEESAPPKDTDQVSSNTTSGVPKPVQKLEELSIVSDVPPPQSKKPSSQEPKQETSSASLTRTEQSAKLLDFSTDQELDNDSCDDNVDNCSMDIDFEISDNVVNSTMNKEADSPVINDDKLKKPDDTNNLFNKPNNSPRAGVLPSSKIPSNLDDSSSISSPSYESFGRSEAKTHFGVKKQDITTFSSCSSEMDSAILNSTSSSEDNSAVTVESATTIDSIATVADDNSKLPSKDPIEIAQEEVIRPENSQSSIQEGESGDDAQKESQTSKETTCFSKLTEFINNFSNKLTEEDIQLPVAENVTPTVIEDLTSSSEHAAEIINVICRPIEPLKEEEITTSGVEAVTFAADEVAPFGEGLAYFVHYPASSQEESQRFIVCDAPLGDEASLNNEASKNAEFVPPRSESVNETPSLSGSQPYTPQSSPNTGIELKQDFGNLGEGSSTVYLYLDNTGTGTPQVSKVPEEQQPVSVKSAAIEDNTSKHEEKREESGPILIEQTSKLTRVETDKIVTDKNAKISKITVEDFRDDLSQSVTSARKITPQEVDKMAKLPFKYSQPLWNENSAEQKTETTTKVAPAPRVSPTQPKIQQGKRRMSQEALSPVRSLKIYSKDLRGGAKDLSQPKDRDMSLKSYKALIKGTPVRRSSVLQDPEPKNNVPKTSADHSKDLLFDNAIEDGPIGKLKRNNHDNFLWSSDSDDDKTEDDGAFNGVINVKPDSQLYRAQDGLKSSRSAGACASEPKSAAVGGAVKRKVIFSEKTEVKEIPSIKKVPASRWTDQIDKLLLESPDLRRIHQQRHTSLYQEMKEKQEQSLQRAQIRTQIYTDKYDPKKKINDRASASANSKVSLKVDRSPYVPSKGRDSGSVYHRNGQRAKGKRKNREESPEEIFRKKIAVRTDLVEKKPKISHPNGKIITPKGILKPVKECPPPPPKVVAAAERNGIDVTKAPSSPVKVTKSGRVCKKPRSAYYDQTDGPSTRSRGKAGGNKL